MAAFSKTAEAVIKVKADTAQANKGISGTVKAMAGLAAGVFAAKKAFDVLSQAASDYAKRAQQMAAASGASYEDVAKAARGLITEQQALEFTAAAMNGAFKLSQADMNNAARAMVALRNQSNDFESVIDNVTRALVEGNGRALRQFGVNVEGSTGKVETFNNVMAALNDLAVSQDANMNIAGDSMIRAGNKYKNATQEFTDALGKLAIALTPIVALFADLVSGFAVLVSSDRDFDTAWRNMQFRANKARQRYERDRRQARIDIDTRIDALLLDNSLISATGGRFSLGATSSAAGGLFDSVFPGALPKPGDKPKPPGGPRGGPPFTVGQPNRGSTNFGTGPGNDFFGNAPSFGSLDQGAITGGLSDFAQVQGLAAGARGSLTGADFGSLKSGIDDVEKMREAMAAMEPVANAFASAGASAFQAWIQGSISAGEAIKKFIGGAITSIATQMMAEGIKHGAMAIGSLAIGNFKGATLHGKAAASHIAGAAAIGALAKGIGVGGGGGGGGGRASGGLPGGAAGSFGGGGGGGSHTTVIVAPNPLEHNPREASRRVRRAFNISASQHAGTNTVGI